MTTPKVYWRITTALLLLIFNLNFGVEESYLEGRWSCDGFSLQLNDNTTLEKQCVGDLNFKSNRSLESTCTAGLFPPGSKWKLSSNKLVLSDSDGKEFTSFDVQKLEKGTLILTRENKVFSFGRSK